MAENHVDRFPEVTVDNWLGVKGENFKKLTTPWEAMPIHQQSAADAYLTVLEHACCSVPKRDSIDVRITEEVRNGTAAHGNNGIITTQEDVGGWPEQQSAEASLD